MYIKVRMYAEEDTIKLQICTCPIIKLLLHGENWEGFKIYVSSINMHVHIIQPAF